MLEDGIWKNLVTGGCHSELGFVGGGVKSLNLM